MRIIGGIAKGRELLFPSKSSERPTSNRIKEALFNILPSVEGKVVLDIFCGTGNVGIEALSRGCTAATFIEKDFSLAGTIHKNILRCDLPNNQNVLNMQMDKAIHLLAKRGACFDIIFADPPYEIGLVKEVWDKLKSGTLLSANGIFVLQHSKREEPDWHKDSGLILFGQKKYGDTLLSLLKRQGEKKIL